MSNESTPLMNPDEITKALDILVEPEQVFEIRILEPKRGNRYTPRVIYGYFNDPAKVPDALAGLRLTGSKGVYVTLNPVNPALLARSQNRFTEAKDSHTTADKDITSRRWLLVDCDPQRPAGISASDEEKAKAHEQARAVYTHLKEDGWPEPVAADSGNGYHLLYRLDLPSESDRVQKCLEALHQRFSTDEVSIDTSVFNPARICKLYGTKAEKGDDCPELGRTHRLSKLLRVPDTVDSVSDAQLAALAGAHTEEAEDEPAPAPRRDSSRNGRKGQSWDKARVQEFIDTHLGDCRPGPAEPYDGGFKWVLGMCPFNSEHTNRSAVIVIKSNGALGFRCHHDGCKGNNWKALRARYEPQQERKKPKPAPIVQVAGDEDLVTEYGPPVMLNAKDEPSDVNQMFVAAKFARDNLILHEPLLNLFYAYDADTGLWKTKTEPRLLVELGHTLRRILHECGGSVLLKKRTQNLMAQIVHFLKGLIERPEVFRHTNYIIHVGNGVLHLDDEPPTFHEFSPDYYSRNRSEIYFDELADCPRFLDELLRPALADDDISLLQRYAGQCLLGCNPSQRILLLRGTPGGGKSTLANILEAVIGTHNVAQLRVQHLAERFEIAGFVGRTLLSGKDVPGTFLNNKSAYVLKALVGGDRLNAEQKNVKHRFELHGDFNVLITSNSRLHVRLDSDSGAWRRRLLIIDYERPPTDKPVPNFDRRLVETEGPGILNWCIEGAIRLLAELETYGRIQLTEEQTKRVDALLCESDSVRHFVSESVEEATGNDITVSELLTAYNNFCDEQGWQAVTVRQFEHQVSDIMMEIHRVAKRTDIKRNDKNQRGFAHVGLKEDTL